MSDFQIKAIGLDLDGTLIDTERTGARHFRAALQAFSLDLTLSEIRGRAGIAEKENDRWLQDRLGISRETVVAVRHEFRRLRDENPSISPMPGAPELLAYCAEREIPRFVATSSVTEEAWSKLRRAGLDIFFKAETVVGRDLVERGKPEPDLIYRGASSIGVHPSAVLYVGDADPDKEAAKAAGATALLLRDVEDLDTASGVRPQRSIVTLMSVLAALRFIRH